jgi:phenylacetate-coenzyme A ligase PaaK-like adenylate-forming protein
MEEAGYQGDIRMTVMLLCLNVPFYRALYKRDGVSPEDIPTLSAIRS